MKFQEYEILQDPKEPPRRYFTDNEHFDLIVWYADKSFKSIAGFQLGYKENPFDTDREYFVSHYPGANEGELSTSETGGELPTYPAPKLLRRSEQAPPPSFFDRIPVVLNGAPSDVAAYLRAVLPSDSKARK
ncbi:MAG TPA: hypothetical protein VFV50_08220 [Bdellovibrionales bacterium]|nr:hypothetical protein [Bdellovibrionales bacterium]